MTAYELADCLEALCKENKGSFTKDAVNMLRQQADRIAELEEEADRLSNHAGKLRELHAERYRKAQERIEKLEKEKGHIRACPNSSSANSFAKVSNASIPQTKPLSDDEINAIRDSSYVQSGIDEWEFDDVVFARKIEERHGIK